MLVSTSQIYLMRTSLNLWKFSVSTKSTSTC